MDSFAGLWSDLQPVGRHAPTGGYRRYAWTAVDGELREWFAAQCAARGLDLVEDRAGNQWAWWGDPDSAPGVVAGSHLDSVPDGGAYDGPLGVVSAFAAIDALRDRGFGPTVPIGVVHFGDEEGARFGIACAGSRVIAGALPADRVRALTDADGVSWAEAYARTGRDPEAVGPDPDTLARVGTFVELHVEQGRGLVDLAAPVGVGTRIWPHGRWRLDFPGEANHAGTTALVDRQDAMLGFARTVLAARAAAERYGCLTTVGKAVVRPNGVNAIPSAVTGWLDARGSDADVVRAVVAEIGAAADGARLTTESWTDPTPFDPDLAARLAGLLGAPRLETGAGHDAGVLAAAGIPTAMLFVRNPTGVSHSPAEFAEEADCRAGVAALTTVLADLAGERR
jgi:N-carbamoyl-L-amino-acid hydrolase